MRTFHRKNCQSVVRKTFTNKFGDIISLVGKHAFEWSVITNKKGKLSLVTFPTRAQATKHFKALCNEYC